MKFLHKQYQAKEKEIIEVELDRAAKVKFMTAMDFKQYKNGRSHKFYGGTFEESPVRFVLPHDAVWYAVVEKGTSADPQDVTASTRLMLPNRAVISSMAADAPQHVRLAQNEERSMIGEGTEENG